MRKYFNRQPKQPLFRLITQDLHIVEKTLNLGV